MIDDKLDDPNSEVITWHEVVVGKQPPLGVKLFLRVQYSYGAVDFTTGYFNGKDFSVQYPPVTHWALSEAANKVWFVYAWKEEWRPTGPKAPPGRIL